jgi:hypothetical protein
MRCKVTPAALHCKPTAADAGFAGVGCYRNGSKDERREIIMLARQRERISRRSGPKRTSFKPSRKP